MFGLTSDARTVSETNTADTGVLVQSLEDRRPTLAITGSTTCIVVDALMGYPESEPTRVIQTSVEGEPYYMIQNLNKY
jgi:hypothetical protein